MTAAAAPARPLSLMAYRVALALVAPLARPLLRARAREGKEDPARLGERLGYAAAARPAGPLVWLHGASVGESVSLIPLIAGLRAERPDLAFLVTSGTCAAANILARRLPRGVIHQYAPVDTPGAVDRFLRHWRPDLGVFAESELWPNLILGAREAGTRLALVSARMGEKSARAWRARPSAARAMLASFDLVLPQDAATAARLGELGARIGGRLNLKRVSEPLPCDAAELERLRAAIGGRPVLLAASTHAPEEALIAAAAADLAPDLLTVIAPRHPERAGEILRQLGAAGVAQRSAGARVTPQTRVYLADTFLELGLFIRLADLVVMGGGFARFGGHNPLEAAQLGRGVVSGPGVANHADVYAEMAGAGAAVIVANEADLAPTLRRLMADPAARQAMGAAAKAYADRQGEELDAALALIRPLLPAA
jgi:3-deoxy-D-manno-octulosonic-acid transferase